MLMMQARCRQHAALALLLALAGGVLMAVPRPVVATTGPTDYLPASHYKVAKGRAALYVGQYLLSSAARAARLSGGAMGIEINSRGYLDGVGQFYGYDEHGNQSSWTATLYNFHETKQHVMVFDLLGPSGTPLLGRVFVTRTRSGDLSGQILLPNGRFNIRWHKISSR